MEPQQYNSRRRPVPYPLAPEVPGYYEGLRGFEWVDDYLKCQKLQNKVVALGEARHELEERWPDRESIKRRLLPSYLALRAKRVDWLKQFISENLHSPDPLAMFYARIKSSYGGPAYVPFFPQDELEEALQKLPLPADAISDEKREKELEKIEAEIARLKMEIQELSPARFFIPEHGKIVNDARQILIAEWWRVQTQVTGPCNCLGVDLNLCDQAEKEAWERFGLKANPYGEYSPNSVWPPDAV